ncbi:MAG TPA: adenylate/guanylate cyclase domain-containing protein, partial [Gaiellaceae bacterium]|nr:adenylate/guanylate cyclase domain-containing protein [Gaiellaceae bacterium]
MFEQPEGVVSLLFTDIEGSTRVLERVGRDRYASLLELHRALIRDAAAAHRGYEVNCEGDSFFFSFEEAADAVAVAIEAQRSLEGAKWPDHEAALRVRMGIHTGEPLSAPPRYVGLDVHRAARVMAAGHGGQILITAATKKAAGIDCIDLGEHRLKDLLEPLRLFQVPTGVGPNRYPPLATLTECPTNLPIQPDHLVGRDRELAELAHLIADREKRLLSFVGPGGAGKTRLALSAAAEAISGFKSGVFVAFLAPVATADLVPNAIADALAIREVAGEPIEETLATYLAERDLLLVLDNFEHLLAASNLVSRLLSNASQLHVLITSRSPLRVRGEQVYEVPPLGTEDALTLLRTRAAPTVMSSPELAGNDKALREICQRLDGLPLAIELAAPLLSLFEPSDLLARLEGMLELLSDGPRDLDERQRTLSGTIAWSYDLLPVQAQRLLDRSSVFVGGAKVADLENVSGIDATALRSLVDVSVG